MPASKEIITQKKKDPLKEVSDYISNLEHQVYTLTLMNVYLQKELNQKNEIIKQYQK